MSKTPDTSELRGRPTFTTKLKQGGEIVARGAAIAGSLAGGVLENVDAQNYPPTPSPRPGIHENVPTDFETSESAYNKYVTDLNGVKPEKTPEARPLAEISPYGPSMEVTEEWLRQNPQNILVFTDFKDQDGNVLEKYTVVDHGYYYNAPDGFIKYLPVPIVYKATLNPTTNKFEQHQPVNNLTGKIYPNSIIKVGNKLIIAGEATYQGANTAVFVSSDDGKTGELIPWKYQNSGSTHSLKKIDNNTVYASNGHTPNGVDQYIIYPDQNTIKATNLGSSAMPEITHYNQLTNEITVVASAMESPSQTGFNVFTINTASGTGSTENLLPNLGLITAITHYKTSSGEYILANGHPFDRLLFIVRVDPATGKPVAEESRISYAKWMDNKNIPGLLKGRLSVSDVHTFVDANNRVHVRVLGTYPITDQASHAILGHFILGTDPDTDSSLFDYIDLGPADLYTGASGFQEKMINGERMLEFEVAGLPTGENRYYTFGGIRAARIPNDGSFDKTLFNPNNGLEQMPADPTPTPTPTPKFLVNLPQTAKGFLSRTAGGW